MKRFLFAAMVAGVGILPTAASAQRLGSPLPLPPQSTAGQASSGTPVPPNVLPQGQPATSPSSPLGILQKLLPQSQPQAPSTTPASPQVSPTHPAVARIYVVEKGSQSVGSGTLVDVREQFGLVVTNWHVIRDAAGEISVVFPDGFRSAARVVHQDQDWDLAALSIWKPNVSPVRISSEAPKPGETLTIAGYGGDGTFRAVSGPCTQYMAPSEKHPHEIVELAAQARQGDSGGPIFNQRGELAGVLFGSAGNTTSGSYGGRVLRFLDPVLKGQITTSPPGSSAPPPMQTPPVADVVAKSTLPSLDDQLKGLNPTNDPRPAAPLAPLAPQDQLAVTEEELQVVHTPVPAPSFAATGVTSAASASGSGFTTQELVGHTPIEQAKAGLSIVGLIALVLFALKLGGSKKNGEAQ